MKSSFAAGLATGAAIGTIATMMIDAKDDKGKKMCLKSDGFFKSVGTVLDSVMNR